MLSRALGFLLLGVCACSSGASSPTDSGVPDQASPNDAASEATTDSATDAAPDAGPTSYALAFPAQSLTPGLQQVLCITERLGNDAPIHVGSLTSHLDAGDFQLVVYLSSATTEQSTPASCSAMGGFTTAGDEPIYIGRATDDTLAFPAGVGIVMDAHQMITLELHQYNAGQATSAGATMTFGVMSDSSFQNAAAMFVQLASSISLPPTSTNDQVSGFNAIPSHMGVAKIFSMTAFENLLGTREQAWNAANASDTSTPIYDEVADAYHPFTQSFATPLTFAANAGIAYRCTYDNNTNGTVVAGPSVNNETCMFASYYYPSQGFELCYGWTCSP